MCGCSAVRVRSGRVPILLFVVSSSHSAADPNAPVAVAVMATPRSHAITITPSAIHGCMCMGGERSEHDLSAARAHTLIGASSSVRASSIVPITEPRREALAGQTL
jgi:hypothetical protein